MSNLEEMDRVGKKKKRKTKSRLPNDSHDKYMHDLLAVYNSRKQIRHRI